MLNKKIYSLILVGVMLLSVLVIMPSANAEDYDPKTIYGTLYINTDQDSTYTIAPSGINITVQVQDYTNTKQTNTIPGEQENYLINIEAGHTDQTCNFTIEYNEITYTPNDNQSIILSEENENGPAPGYYIIDLHVTITEEDTEPPSKITGLSVTDAKDGKLNLEWDAATETDFDHYNIYWNQDGYTNPIDTETTTSYQDTGLTNGQNYCYKISAVDTNNNEGEQSDQNCATPTKKSTPPPYVPPPYIPPSGDDDDDDDTDDGEDNDTDDGEMIIPNNHPVIVNFTGTLTGTQNTEYTYSVLATDADGHDISYTFYWADSTKNVTEFVAENTTYNITHAWSSAGIYTINVNAIDDYQNGNGTPSGNTSLQVLIDVHIIDNGDVDGYLIDENGNGTYDEFHNNENGSDSGVKKDGEFYLLDTDGNGKEDYKYNPSTGLGETIEEETEEPSGGTEPAGEDNTLLYVGAALIVIVLLLLFFLATRKKNKK